MRRNKSESGSELPAVASLLAEEVEAPNWRQLATSTDRPPVAEKLILGEDGEEDSDYEGHSLTMLKRIAAAANKRVEIRFVPKKEKLQPA